MGRRIKDYKNSKNLIKTTLMDDGNLLDSHGDKVSITRFSYTIRDLEHLFHCSRNFVYQHIQPHLHYVYIPLANASIRAAFYADTVAPGQKIGPVLATKISQGPAYPSDEVYFDPSEISDYFNQYWQASRKTTRLNIYDIFAKTDLDKAADLFEDYEDTKTNRKIPAKIKADRLENIKNKIIDLGKDNKAARFLPHILLLSDFTDNIADRTALWPNYPLEGFKIDCTDLTYNEYSSGDTISAIKNNHSIFKVSSDFKYSALANRYFFKHAAIKFQLKGSNKSLYYFPAYLTNVPKYRHIEDLLVLSMHDYTLS